MLTYYDCENFITKQQSRYKVDEITYCPICHCSIKPIVLQAMLFDEEQSGISVHYLCPNCNVPFITVYLKKDYLYYARSETVYEIKFAAPQNFQPRDFSGYIQSVSSNFIEIYNQALEAEIHDLDQITGPGYRKALEFLIKDFIVKEQAVESEKPIEEQDKALTSINVEKANLGDCIKSLNDQNLIITASRAAWLGNDQVHYTKKFEDFDIEHLKKFIDISVRHIESILITREAQQIQARSK